MAEIKMDTEQPKNSFEQTVSVRIQEDMRVQRNRYCRREQGLYWRGAYLMFLSVCWVHEQRILKNMA
jgi:hypothetical protein